MNTGPEWFRLSNENEVLSPSLLIYAERVGQNIQKMIEIAGGVERLRPHMKTHKMPAVIKLQLAKGITKFKCATIAESEMTAACGAADVLFAYQPVGPNIRRFLELQTKFPKTRFATLADNIETLNDLSAAAVKAEEKIEIFLDIDCGQHRSGIAPGESAIELYSILSTLPGLKASGLHIYDGHIGDADLTERTVNCRASIEPALRLKESLIEAGLPVPRTVLGGSPSFAIVAKTPDIECSPGTTVLWDAVSATKFPDLPFSNAALVLTRVVSKPVEGTICLDLGHKSIASEMPHPRVLFPQLPDAKCLVHNEEHMVIETKLADSFAIGDCLYGVPWHVCPTVALHSAGTVIRDGKAGESWEVTARARKLTI